MMWCFALSINLLHDDYVDSIHGHEEQGLPPERQEAQKQILSDMTIAHVQTHISGILSMR